MTDLATWITGGVSALAAVVAIYFAARADRAQRTAVIAQQEATQAAREAAESADKAQRIQVRPALRLQWTERPLLPANNAPIVLSLEVRNVGHGTATIERVRLLEYGNLRVEFHDTRGAEQRIVEQFDTEIFQRLEGVLMQAIPVQLRVPPLTEVDRALDVGAIRVLFELEIGAAHAARIIAKFRQHCSANVQFRSMAGEEFNTDQQFADLRNAQHRPAVQRAAAV